jgi:hypothetical protein
LNGVWVPHDNRDAVVDFITYWVKRSEIPAYRIRGWLGLAASKHSSWLKRYGKVNEHNSLIPRDFWLEEWERQCLVEYYKANPGEGYRRLTLMMLDDDAVAVSPSSGYEHSRYWHLEKRGGQFP